MKTRRRAKAKDTIDHIGDENNNASENLHLDKGDLVLCQWQGVWWPGYVEELQDSSSYVIGFWNEDECVIRRASDVCSFDGELPVIASSLKKLQKCKSLLNKYKNDLSTHLKKSAQQHSPSMIESRVSPSTTCTWPQDFSSTTEPQASPSVTGPQDYSSSAEPQASPSMTGQQVSPSKKGQQVSPSKTGQQVSPSMTEPQAYSSMTGQQASPSMTEPQASPSMTEPYAFPTMTGPQDYSSPAEPQASSSSPGQQVSPSMTEPQASPSTAEPQASPSMTEPHASPSMTGPQDYSSPAEPQASSSMTGQQVSPSMPEPQASPSMTEPQASPSITEPQVSTFMTGEQASPSMTEPQASPSMKEAHASPSKTEPQDYSSSSEPQASPSETGQQASPSTAKPHASLSMTDPHASPSMTRPQASPSTKKPHASPSMTEPQASPSMTEPHASPSMTEPQASPSMKAPQTSPSMTEPQASPSMTEPQASPSITEPQASPSMTEPQASPSITEPQASSSLTEPKDFPSPTEPQNSLQTKPQVSTSMTKPHATSSTTVPNASSSKTLPQEPSCFKSVVCVHTSDKKLLIEGEYGESDGRMTFVPTAVIEPFTLQQFDDESDYEQSSNEQPDYESSDQSYQPNSSESESDSEMETQNLVYKQKRSRSFSESENEEEEMETQNLVYKQKRSRSFSESENEEEAKQKKRVLTKCDTSCEMIDNSDSDISEIFPIQIPASGPISLKDMSLDEESDDSDYEEEEINRDINNKSIFVRRIIRSSTTKTGKAKRSDRVYNSKCCCPFCRRICSSFAQHIFSKKHCNEPEVKKILSLKGKHRKTLLSVLRSKGSNIHNENVIKLKKGEILLARRSGKEQFDVRKYGPCPNCFGWLRLSVLDRHQTHCPANKNLNVHVSKGSLLMQSAVLAGRVTEEASQALVNEVFSIMLDDKVGKVAKSDSLIIALGNQWLTRNIGNKLMRKHYVSAVMRLASRLLIQLQIMATPENGNHLENYLHPMFFTHVARAALKVARQDNDDEENLEAPSNAIKLSYDLKRVGNIKLAKAIKNGDGESRKAAKDFLKLMEIEWTTRLSRVLLHERKNNKENLLPLPKDVEKLASYLKTEMEMFDTDDSSYVNFRKGVVLVESNLISYNRRRPGEVQAMRLTAYEKRKTGMNHVAEELTGSLTKFEKQLVEDQDVIEIRGKCGKFVPVIVPKHARRILKFLTSNDVRKSAGISERNPYVFASNREGIIRGYDSVRTITEAAGLEHPERIRGTNMRRLMATLCQAIDVSPQQQQWIVDHLGHTLNVHQIHYRCTSDLIERVDIAKLLLLMDTRKVGQFKGKKLEDIQLEELLSETDTRPEGDEHEAEDNNMSITGVDETKDEEANLDDDYIPDIPEEEEDIPLVACKKKGKKKSMNRHKWTAQEIEELRVIFQPYFEAKRTPGEKAICKGKHQSEANHGKIWQLPVDKIKKKISWIRLHPSKD